MFSKASKKCTMTVIVILFSVMVFSNQAGRSTALDYLKAFFEGRYEVVYEMQNERLRSALNVEKIEQTRQSILNMFGGMQAVVSTESDDMNGLKRFVVLIETGKGYLQATVSVDVEDKVAGIFFKQGQKPVKKEEEIKDMAYVEQEVQFGKEGWKLDGRLTIPEDEESYPLIIITGGSGPTDMDGTYGPNKPYRDIAHYLAENGVGSLRYNKRSAQYPQKMLETEVSEKGYIWDEYLEDLYQAIEFVTEIDGAGEIILAGHSLGGTIVPYVANNTEEVDGIILLAAAVRRLAQISIDQHIYLKEHLNITDEQLEQTVAFYNQVLNHEIPADTELQKGFTVGYFYDLDHYNIMEELKKNDMPVLVIQGKTDFQSTMEGDYLPLKEAFSDQERFTFRAFDGVNHLLMPSPDEYMTEDAFHSTEEYAVENEVDERVLNTLVDWVNTTF